MKLGKGKISAIYFNAGSAYLGYKSHILRDYMSNQISVMFPGQTVKVSGSHLVHVVLTRLNDKLYVNLINAAGDHNGKATIGYDEVPSLENIEVRINTGSRPKKIILQPEGRELTPDYENGVSHVVVPSLHIHSILEVIM